MAVETGYGRSELPNPFSYPLESGRLNPELGLITRSADVLVVSPALTRVEPDKK